MNLGVRLEKEDVPSYQEGVSGLKFGLGSKIAPRIGVAYDVTGDGKTKISGFYGLFYDRFKLTLSRRTFGGEKYHKLYFDLFPTDTMAAINRQLVTGGAPLTVGTVCPENTTTPIYGRVRCDVDQGFANPDEFVDPDLKPFQQREITFTFQRQLSKDYMFSARYTRKQVLHTVEDAGFPTEAKAGLAFVTVNPGEGMARRMADELGIFAPKAQRQFDALEFRLDRRFAQSFFFSANYTWSRLYGNYGGLASSDEEGRMEPNIERYFDSPGAGFTASGGADNGRLPTDVPHAFKAFGTYSLNWDRFGLWKSNSTDFQFYFNAASGSVLTSFVQVDGVEQVILSKRGDLGRTPLLTQTDFALRHSINFGREGRFSLKFEADILNVFNESAVTSTGRSNFAPLYQTGNMISPKDFSVLDPANGLVTQAMLNTCLANSDYRPCWGAAYQAFQANGAPAILAAVGPGGSAVKNPYYNIPMTYQPKRTVRYGVRFLF